MTPTTEDFLTRLRVRVPNRKRISAEIYRQVFAEILPTLTGADFRARLAMVCAELQVSGRAKLPRRRQLYDHAGVGSLPMWLELIDESKPREPLPCDPRTHPWPPELRFACDVTDPRQLSELLCVQHFFAAGGRTRPLVPAKERSVELFGDEKRLEEMRRSSLFNQDRLSLELLRCFVVRPPLVHDLAPATAHPRPLMVLENHSTYYSFAHWNRRHGIYAAVVFGSGDSFKTGAAGLAEVGEKGNWNGKAYYFGDIDVKGLLIPLAATLTLLADGYSPLLPQTGCYARAMDLATNVALPASTSTQIPEGASDWLGPQLAESVQSWLSRGIRIPQELVGWEDLHDNGHGFLHDELALGK